MSGCRWVALVQVLSDGVEHRRGYYECDDDAGGLRLRSDAAAGLRFDSYEAVVAFVQRRGLDGPCYRVLAESAPHLS